jgi:hypothetical protein
MSAEDGLPQEPVDSDLEEDDENKRSYETMATVAIIIIVVILVLLFWRQCGSNSGDSEAEGGGGEIVSVPPLEIQEGAVSIWAKEGADVDAVLARAGLMGSEYIGMGVGTFVVSVDPGDEEAAIEELKGDPDLLDAGFVYTEELADPEE